MNAAASQLRVDAGGVTFVTTHWSVVLTAQGHSAAADEALEKDDAKEESRMQMESKSGTALPAGKSQSEDPTPTSPRHRGSSGKSF